jgi:hypothetical protein
MIGTCPSDFSWAAVPTSATAGQATLEECSGKGICNRDTGMCRCFDGFTGRACERSTTKTNNVTYCHAMFLCSNDIDTMTQLPKLSLIFYNIYIYINVVSGVSQRLFGPRCVRQHAANGGVQSCFTFVGFYRLLGIENGHIILSYSRVSYHIVVCVCGLFPVYIYIYT